MDKKMVYLISLIAELSKKININKVYSKKFEDSKNKYLSPTEKIRIEDLTDYFVTAGIVGRTEILPIINKDGFQILEFEPDVIGGQFPYSASDLIQLQAGIPMITATGKEIPTLEQLEGKYSKIIASAISNRFEKQCAEVYLKGTYTDKDGKELIVGVKDNKSITWAKKAKYSDELLKMALDYQTKFGVFPNIEVGQDIFNAIKNEANDSNQNINGVKFVFKDVPYLEVGGKHIELLVNAKGTDDKVISTEKMIILSEPKNLAIGYGCLTYGDVKSNESKLVRAELIAGETRVESTTGSKGLWGKSAPMPIVLSDKKFIRYEVTIA